MPTKYDISLGLTGRYKRKSSGLTATIIRKEIVMSGAVGSRTENGKPKKPKTTYPCRFCRTITIGKTCQKCKDRIAMAPKVTRYHVKNYSLAEYRAFGDELREKMKSGINTSDGNAKETEKIPGENNANAEESV